MHATTTALLSRYGIANAANLAVLDLTTLGLSSLDALTDDAMTEARNALAAQRDDAYPVATQMADLVDRITAEKVRRVANPPAPTAALPALGTVSPPASHQPSAQLARTEPRIMRMGDRELCSFDDVVAAIGEGLDAARSLEYAGTNFPREYVKIGRLAIDVDADRRLDGGPDDAARIDAVCRDAWQPDRWTEALVASGGFCGPAQPWYDLPQVATAARPVVDAVPRFVATRGKVTVMQPSRLEDIPTSTAQVAGSAVSVWTNAVDVTPGELTKPRMTLACPTTTTITTQAIVQRVRFSNFQARGNPELVADVLANVASAHARVAEGQLLASIATSAIKLTTTQVLGAASDLIGYIHQGAAGMRSRQRMPEDARVRCLLPSWVANLIGADLAHAHPGDGLARYTQDPRAFVRQACAAAGVNVSFYLDTAAGGTNQLFSTPTNNADLPNFPPGPATTSARVVWYLWIEGSFAFLDGGTLDLGIVRDSTLNNTNDAEMFAESFEAVAPRVVEAQQITSTLCPTGAGAIDIATTAYCTAS